MNESLQRLFALHQVDERIHRAQQGLKALDEPLPLEQQMQKVLAELARQETMLSKAQAHLKNEELQLRSLEEKRELDRKKLYGGQIVGTRELQALEKEIENLSAAISAAEEQVLEVMEKTEALRANVEKLKEYQKAGETKLAATKKNQEQERKRFQADLLAVQPLREPAAQQVEPGLLRLYDRIRDRSGHPGLSVVKDVSCGQCHNSIPSFGMRDLEAGKILQCDSCTRIMYLPPEEH